MLALLLGLAFRLPPLRVGGVRAIIAAAAAAPVLVIREAGGVGGGQRVTRVRVGRVAKARQVAIDLAEILSGASLVAFVEDDLDAARGEERVVPEVDQLGGHERRARRAVRVGCGQFAGPCHGKILDKNFFFSNLDTTGSCKKHRQPTWMKRIQSSW